MTKIRIKTPTLRREMTIESIGNSGNEWQVSMSGYRSQTFTAPGLHAAIDKGLELKDGLQVSQEELDRRAAASARMKLNPIHRAQSAEKQPATTPAIPAEKSGRDFRKKGLGSKDESAAAIDTGKVA